MCQLSEEARLEFVSRCEVELMRVRRCVSRWRREQKKNKEKKNRKERKRTFLEPIEMWVQPWLLVCNKLKNVVSSKICTVFFHCSSHLNPLFKHAVMPPALLTYIVIFLPSLEAGN